MKQFCVSLAIAASVSGCSGYLPNLPPEKEIPIAAVVKSVQCEMQDAVRRVTANGRHKWLLGWEAAYALTLNVSEIEAVKLTPNTFPIKGSSVSVTPGFGIGDTGTAKRIVKVNFTPKVSEIASYACGGYQAKDNRMFVAGRIGFGEWLERAADGIDPGAPQDRQTPKGSEPLSIGHTFEFTLDVSANASAPIGLSPSLVSINPNGSVERIDDDTLDVSFAKAKNVTTETKAKVPVVSFEPVKPSPKDKSDLALAGSYAQQADQKQIEFNSKVFPQDLNGNLAKQNMQLEIAALRAQSDALVANVANRLAPKPVTKLVDQTSTTIQANTANLNALEALQSLQLERLLSGVQIRPVP